MNLACWASNSHCHSPSRSCNRVFRERILLFFFIFLEKKNISELVHVQDLERIFCAKLLLKTERRFPLETEQTAASLAERIDHKSAQEESHGDTDGDLNNTEQDVECRVVHVRRIDRGAVIIRDLIR